jgi:hypothetical protein
MKNKKEAVSGRVNNHAADAAFYIMKRLAQCVFPPCGARSPMGAEECCSASTCYVSF